MLKLGFRICTFYVLEYDTTSHSLSIGFPLSEFHLTYPIRHFSYVTTQSIDHIRNSAFIYLFVDSSSYRIPL